MVERARGKGEEAMIERRSRRWGKGSRATVLSEVKEEWRVSRTRCSLERRREEGDKCRCRRRMQGVVAAWAYLAGEGLSSVEMDIGEYLTNVGEVGVILTTERKVPIRRGRRDDEKNGRLRTEGCQFSC